VTSVLGPRLFKGLQRYKIFRYFWSNQRGLMNETARKRNYSWKSERGQWKRKRFEKRRGWNKTHFPNRQLQTEHRAVSEGRRAAASKDGMGRAGRPPRPRSHTPRGAFFHHFTQWPTTLHILWPYQREVHVITEKQNNALPRCLDEKSSDMTVGSIIALLV